MLECRDITHSYGTFTVLEDVSVQLPPASVTVLMGRSGSGKSTLTRILSMVEAPTKGQVLFNSTIAPNDRGDSSGRTPWPRVTVLFQQVYLWPHLRVRDNIHLPARLRGLPLNEVPTLCDELGLGECMELYPNELSIGQRQRAGLIRALMLRPEYLLLDELTAAQDVEQIANLLEILVRFARTGTALFVVTHHINFARTLLAASPESQLLFLHDRRLVRATGAKALDCPEDPALNDFLGAIRRIT